MYIALLGQSRDTNKVIVINNDTEGLVALRIDKVEHEGIFIHRLGTLGAINRIITDIHPLDVSNLRSLNDIRIIQILERLKAIIPEDHRRSDSVVNDITLSLRVISGSSDGLHVLNGENFFLSNTIASIIDLIHAIGLQSTDQNLVIRQLLNGPARDNIDSRHNNCLLF